MSTEKNKAKKKPAKARKLHPIRYIKEMWGEVKKLSWLSARDLVRHTVAVIVFVLVMSAMVYALDFAFGSGVKGINDLFGGGTAGHVHDENCDHDHDDEFDLDEHDDHDDHDDDDDHEGHDH